MLQGFAKTNARIKHHGFRRHPGGQSHLHLHRKKLPHFPNDILVLRSRLHRPRLAPHVPVAPHAHARIDDWREAQRWISARFADGTPAPIPVGARVRLRGIATGEAEIDGAIAALSQIMASGSWDKPEFKARAKVT